jgi:hypothetical protein
MSKKYVVYVLLLLAVAMAGCTYFQGLMAPQKHLGEEAAPVISFPSTDTPPASQRSAQLPDTKPFDLSKARWVEYRLTGLAWGQPYSSTVRLEYGSSSGNGVNMQSVKRTIKSNDGASVNVYGTGKLFNWQSSNFESSMTSSSMVPFEQIKRDDPIMCAGDISGSPVSSESVTVPDGTYDCKKYMGSFKGYDSMYWETPGVPVPVKVYTAWDGVTLELVDWG